MRLHQINFCVSYKDTGSIDTIVEGLLSDEIDGGVFKLIKVGEVVTGGEVVNGGEV